jgi:molybdenum cofactor cytidylyltransferase
MSSSLCIAIMAAGAARRFKGPKLDVDLFSKRLGRHAVDAALQLDTKNLVIIVGDTCPKFAREAEADGIAKLLCNPEARLGLAGSIGVAVRYAAKAKSVKLLLMLGDMPFVASSTLRRLADAATVGCPAATHYSGGKVGIPVCLTADLFEDMLQLQGDRGASSYLSARPQCLKIDVPVRELSDIDTRTELAALSSRSDELPLRSE